MYHWAKEEERIFQWARIPVFEDLLGSLLCSAKTKLSPEKRNSCNHLPQHMADVLRQIPSDLSVGSQTEILTEAQKWTSFHIEVLHAHHTCEHVHILSFFHHLGGGGNVRVKFSYCILDVQSERVAGEKRSHLGVVAAVQHYTPSYCVFIWLACWLQGTAFWLSKKAVQYYLILSCIKCTDCFMNHYLLLIRFLNKVWATIQPVKYFAVSKRRLICERGLDSFCNILSLKLISFEVLGFL